MKLLYLVPGTFKTINNKCFDQEKGEEFEFVEPGKVKPEIDKLLSHFIVDISDTTKPQKDIIFTFVLDFSHIHPFADGNGKVAVILLDILLVKYGHAPVHINKIKEKNMNDLYKATRHHDLHRKLDKLYEVIDKYST